MLAVIALLMAAVAADTNKQEPSITLPEGITCNDLFWTTKGKPNASGLSDYQECWLSQHRGEDNTGEIGGQLWVKAEGNYYSVNKNLLRSSFLTEEKAKQAFIREITKQVNANRKSK